MPRARRTPPPIEPMSALDVPESAPKKRGRPRKDLGTATKNDVTKTAAPEPHAVWPSGRNHSDPHWPFPIRL